MTATPYIIKTMSRAEIDLAVGWATAEGWNPGQHDATCYHTADPHGFLIGYLGTEPIASISVVKYGETFGFLGFYIVTPAHRGHGYGLQIWNAGLDYLAGRNIGLDGVVAQQENYKKSGFKLAYRNIRYAYEGHSDGQARERDHIVPLTAVSFATVAAYDRPFFPEPRPHFLQAWLTQPGTTALGIMHNGELAGYGVIRPCHVGYKIGPLVADAPELADALFRALANTAVPNQPIYLDVPEVNPTAVALAQRHHMQPAFETARMYTGDFPTLPLERIFGVTSFEVG